MQMAMQSIVRKMITITEQVFASFSFVSIWLSPIVSLGTIKASQVVVLPEDMYLLLNENSYK